MPFYVFGIAGPLWMIVWFKQVKNDPRDDSRIDAKEHALESLLQTHGRSSLHLPLRRLLLRWPTLAVVIGGFASSWTLNILLSWLPSYFRDAQGLSIANAGHFSAAPWLAMAVAMNVAASLADRTIPRGASVTSVRKLMQCGGLIASAACLTTIDRPRRPLFV